VVAWVVVSPCAIAAASVTVNLLGAEGICGIEYTKLSDHPRKCINLTRIHQAQATLLGVTFLSPFTLRACHAADQFHQDRLGFRLGAAARYRQLLQDDPDESRDEYLGMRTRRGRSGGPQRKLRALSPGLKPFCDKGAMAYAQEKQP
jgi:hypothetical protein